MDLKPCRKRYPEMVAAVGALSAKAKGAYWVRYTIVDHYGVLRQHYRPFLAIDRHADDSPLLIGMPGLKAMGVSIHIGDDATWHYSLQKHGKPFVEMESSKKFRKRLRKGPRVYALVLHNPLIQQNGDKSLKDILKELPPEISVFEDVFSPTNAKALAPHREGIDLAIDLQDGKQPPYGPLYPLSPAELEVLREYIQENLDKGFIRHSKSPAGAPVLFVPKKDGGLRLCVDYRGLNAITIKNRYPLPLIGEIMDRVSGSTWFSKIDLKDAYYRIRIKAGDEWKTAFRTRYGHFEFLVMPMGLTNSPAAFQAYINNTLRGLVDRICIVYLDDILIFSKTREEHTDHLRQVCQRLREHELYAKPSKCEFYQDRMEFLGFIISAKGVEMDPTRIQTIQEWKNHPPRSYHDVQVFLGFCNYYRRFIRRYSHISRPITSLLKGSKNGRKTGDFSQEWKEKQQNAFLELLDAFTRTPILRHYDPARPSRIETDASDVAVGAIYSQLLEHDNQWHPVAYFSRQFKGAEVHYSTPDKEMMAIVEAFKQWRHYLEGSTHPIEVWTDHKNLQSFMKQPRLNGRQARWCFALCPYDFTIKFRKGTTNPADAPSRRPDYNSDPSESAEEQARGLLATLEAKVARVSQVRVTYIRHTLAGSGPGDLASWSQSAQRPTGPQELEQEAQRSTDPWRDATAEKTSGELCPEPTGHLPGREVRGETEEADHLLRVIRVQTITRRTARVALRDEEPKARKPSENLESLVMAAQKEDAFAQRILRELEHQKGRPHYSVTQSGALRFKERLYVPNQRSLIGELMRLYHDDEHAGHWGVEKTLELLKRKFQWKGMKEDVEDYVRTCPVCQGNSVSNHKPYGKLSPLPRPSRPWKDISLDWITGLPPSRKGNDVYDAILTIVDRFTKMAIFLPCKSTMDAAEFAEAFYREVEMRFGPPSSIVSDRDSRITSKFWAEVCLHAIIKRRLSTAFHPQTDGQTEVLNKAIENYLRAFTNLEQMNWANLLPTAAFAYNNSYNHSLQMTPFRCMYGYDPEIRIDVADDVPEGKIPSARDRVKQLHDLREQLQRQWAKAQEHQIKYYNQRHLPIEFRRGQLVKLSTRNLKLKDKKLAPRWVGPFKITRTIGGQAYELALPEQYARLHPVFPVQLLEKWHARDDTPAVPLPELEDDPDEYEVEEIREKSLRDGRIEYLVKWAGWPSEYNQWVDKDDINAPELIRKFEARWKSKGRKHKETNL